MAARRPGFARYDTDGIPPSEITRRTDPLGQTAVQEMSDMDRKGVVSVEASQVDSEEPTSKSSKIVSTAEDLVTQIISVEDDPNLSPWTFRMFFLGIGLSVFGSVLQEIFYFKPQTIWVSAVFLTVIAYVLGEAMSVVLPRRGRIGRILNPFPFNLKEHAAITLMASAGAQSAQATEALAAQQLFYGGYPSHAAGIFITLSSQLIGYAIAGLLREVLVYPTKVLWPQNLPVISLLETLHKDKAQAKVRLKVFYIVFAIIFVWEVFPQYIFTLLEGVSIFCLASQHNMIFTNLFGGASGNEGLGFLSICLDWEYVASFGSPMFLPLQTLTNQLIGYLCCIALFMGLFYNNVWNAQNFPFLSQLMFDGNSSSTAYQVFNQTTIINPQGVIEQSRLEIQGIPWLTASYVAYLLTSNMGITATLTHMMLWNYDDIKAGWDWARPSNLAKPLKPSFWLFWKNQETPEERLARKESDPKLDPHYKLMLRNKYVESPQWWWASVLIISWAVGLGCLSSIESTLPWWGFLMSTILCTVFVLFFATQMGITGFQFNVQPICQMLAGYMFPGRPLANLYFTCYTFNALQMGEILARDLKLGQHVHLPPRVTFLVQIMGCVIGALFNYVMMITIVENQAEILLSIDGTNIWSGQNVQFFNTSAISWSIAKEMFSVGGRYQWVTLVFLLGFAVPLPFYLAHRVWPKVRLFSYINLSIILYYAGNLYTGINSSTTMFLAIGFFSQLYLRRYRPRWFVKYNYVVSAALDGGTQVLLFILTFAVFGGSGNAVPFPYWAGNPDPTVANRDYCMVDPALAG